MAESTDSSLAFFSKGSPNQWSYVLALYKDVLKLKAAQRTKKNGPEELIKLDSWYQEQLPKAIHSRKEIMLTHTELVQIMKWKLMRGKFRPRLIDLVKINTELAVKNITKKAFKKMIIPNLSSAITALTTLKGIGPATASAVLAAGFPQHAPYMADESMLSTPGIEATDYTLAEYLNYAEQIQVCTDRLNKQDPEGQWTPHKIELTLWTHYVARELNPALLDDLPAKCDNYHKESSTTTVEGITKDEVLEDGGTLNGKNHGKEESNGKKHPLIVDEQSKDSTNDSSDKPDDVSDDDSSQSSSKGIEKDQEPTQKKIRVN